MIMIRKIIIINIIIIIIIMMVRLMILAIDIEITQKYITMTNYTKDEKIHPTGRPPAAELRHRLRVQRLRMACGASSLRGAAGEGAARRRGVVQCADQRLWQGLEMAGRLADSEQFARWGG